VNNDAEAESVYGHGFGFDNPAIDKGKGKAKIQNIHKDTEMNNENPKESLESTTSSSTTSSSISYFSSHYRAPTVDTGSERQSFRTSESLPLPYYTTHPKAPFNSPTISREDITSGRGSGVFGVGG
jgi:hypothetical protein